jgi:hypothetical protein
MFGVNYDTGVRMNGVDTRPSFEPAVVRRELRVIAEDLHAGAVRISGDHLGRITEAAGYAHEAGLAVWFSPFPHGLDAGGLASYLAEAARSAEALRRAGGRVVLVLGCEMTVFGAGFLPGATFMDRLALLGEGGSAQAVRSANARASDTHPHIVAAARAEFGGDITYAAGLWEKVDWRLYDRVSIDAYRDAGNAAGYREILRSYRRWGKPVAVIEFGCCTYEGAGADGAAGLLAVELHEGKLRLRPGIVRDELAQVRYFTEVWDTLRQEGVDDAFWFTFAAYFLPHDASSPADDLDAASFGLVAVDGQSAGNSRELPWRPKAAFWAVQQAFAGAAHPK